MGLRWRLGRKQIRGSDTKVHGPSKIVNRREPAEPRERKEG